MSRELHEDHKVPQRTRDTKWRPLMFMYRLPYRSSRTVDSLYPGLKRALTPGLHVRLVGMFALSRRVSTRLLIVDRKGGGGETDSMGTIGLISGSDWRHKQSDRQRKYGHTNGRMDNEERLE